MGASLVRVLVDKTLAQAISLLVAPSDLLFQSTQLRLRLGSHDDGTRSVSQNEIDDAARRFGNGNFYRGMPAWIEHSDQCLDHHGLESIVEARSRPGKVPDTEIGTERDADRRQHLEARPGLPTFDASNVRPMDADDPGKRRQRDAGFEAHPADVFADPEVESPHPRRGGALHCRSGDRHMRIQPLGPYPAIIWVATRRAPRLSVDNRRSKVCRRPPWRPDARDSRGCASKAWDLSTSRRQRAYWSRRSRDLTTPRTSFVAVRRIGVFLGLATPRPVSPREAGCATIGG